MQQEMASIIRSVLEFAGDPSPYYFDIPENFAVPSIYFPSPELETSGETFFHYGTDYTIYAKCFAMTSEDAYWMALLVAAKIREKRNLIPLISSTGEVLPGQWVRVGDPSAKPLDDGAAQLKLTWRTRKPYEGEEPQKMMEFDLDFIRKAGRTVSEEEAERLAEYIKNT